MTDFQERYCAARRSVIAQDLRRLNPMQRQAAMTTEGPLLLLAGAGSGKTTVLIQRIYVLLTYGRGSDTDSVPEAATEEDLSFLETFPEHPSPEEVRRARKLCAVDPPRPWEITAITFTNKAAGELKDRLAARLGPAANDVWASTFHSACVRILRRDIDRLGFERDFTIYDTDDSKRVLKEVLKELNLDEKSFPLRQVLSDMGRAKDRFLGPAEMAAQYDREKDWRMSRVAKIYAAYEKRLHAANALDFDDIIFHTVTLLKQEPEVLRFYQNKFRYVLVDEYQDTNHIQYLLTSLLAGGQKNLCVVGDDDQSIYGFRGAAIENILNFENQYPDARVIRLEQNYRSSRNILNAANAVIENNLGRKGKTLWTENGAGEPVRVHEAYNETDEASFVTGDILAQVKTGRQFRDCAVLYRMNAQSNALEYDLRRNGVPYKVVGGMKFFDRAEVKDMLAYLCVLNNPSDDLRLRRIINNPSRKIGAATLDKIAAIAEEQGASLYEIIRNADLFPDLKSARPKLTAFADFIDRTRKKGGEMELPEFYDLVCTESGYVKVLEDRGDAESRVRLDNVRELKSSILGFLERSPEDASLAGFLNEIALYTDLDSLDGADNSVTLMTIHAAKGLEFPVVYVVGMEEGIFPSSNAMYRAEDLEEERRLCYVAMTRAREQLVLTHARLRMLYGRTSSNPESRFLGEVPEENSRREGARSGSGFRPVRAGAWESGGFAARPVRSADSAAVSESRGGTVSAEPDRPVPSFQPGERVEHTAFGPGTVRSVRAVAGDVLAEVAFDTAGVKKLMLKYAGAQMKRL